MRSRWYHWLRERWRLNRRWRGWRKDELLKVHRRSLHPLLVDHKLPPLYVHPPACQCMYIFATFLSS
jgi:hypothetical protein